MGQTNVTIVTIISPPLNSTLVRGHTYTIKWLASGHTTSFPARISLTTPFGDNGFTDKYLNIANVQSGHTNSFTWTVPTYKMTPGNFPFPDGTYWMKVVPINDIGQVEAKPFFFSVSSTSSDETVLPLIQTNLLKAVK
jgi:hypothetical protein